VGFVACSHPIVQLNDDKGGAPGIPLPQYPQLEAGRLEYSSIS